MQERHDDRAAAGPAPPPVLFDTSGSETFGRVSCQSDASCDADSNCQYLYA